MTLVGGIGDFHVKGHVTDCFARFSLSFMEGARVIDGEILETLWSVLNKTSQSTKGSSLAHWNKILDDHMNHSNWKKLIGMGKMLDY
jgi:Kyakuja-Dileera-Zisupton transposase